MRKEEKVARKMEERERERALMSRVYKSAISLLKVL